MKTGFTGAIAVKAAEDSSIEENSTAVDAQDVSNKGLLTFGNSSACFTKKISKVDKIGNKSLLRLCS